MSYGYRFKLVLFACTLCFLFAFEQVLLLGVEQTAGMAVLYVLYIIAVLLLLGSLALFAGIFGTWAFVLALGLIVTLSIFLLKVSYYDYFLSFKTTEHFAMFAVVFVGMVLGLRAIVRRGLLPAKGSYLLAVLFFCLPPMVVAIKAELNDGRNFGDVDPRWAQVDLTDRPNIYLLSYDALIPEEAVKTYLGVPSSPYQDLFATDFHEYTPALVLHGSTMYSLNALLQLDQDGEKTSKDHFAGRTPSNLSKLLQANEYSVSSGMGSYFFGAKGKYIDTYVVPENVMLSQTVLCQAPNVRPILAARGFFVCRTTSRIRKILGIAGPRQLPWWERYSQQLQRISSNSGPTFALLYTNYPFQHTSQTYRHQIAEDRREYREYFLESAAEMTANLRGALEIIKANDPRSIVIVFGDHGAYFSRFYKTEAYPNFVYKDRYRVALASLKTDHACSGQVEQHYSKPYATPSRLILDVLVCLGADKSKLDKLLDFDEPERILRHALGNDWDTGFEID